MLLFTGELLARHRRLRCLLSLSRKQLLYLAQGGLQDVHCPTFEVNATCLLSPSTEILLLKSQQQGEERDRSVSAASADPFMR